MLPTDVEVIIADASTDSTAQIASSFPVNIVTSAKGRAAQMNAGAAVAKADILYFLHVDTQMPTGGVEMMEKAVHAGKSAGCFRMHFDDSHWLMQFYGWCTRFPFQVCRGGDQSLFITKALFDEIGGFDSSLIVMEDIEIITRIKEKATFHILPMNVTTSARKYHHNGRVRLQLLFGTLHLLYALGVSQEKLAAFYKQNIH